MSVHSVARGGFRGNMWCNTTMTRELTGFSKDAGLQ